MINTIGSPNSGQLVVGVAIVLHDKFTNQAREASKEMKRLYQDAKQVTNANLSAVRTISTMVGAGALALSAGLASAVKQGAEFVDTMTFVDAIAEKSGVSLDQLSKKARTLGRETMWTSQDIASAMQYFAMAGMNTSEIYNNIEAAANLAGSTMSALGGKGGTADIMTNIMKMFRIESSEINSTRVADVLTKGVTSSNTSLYDLAEAIKYAGTTVTNLGGSLEQTAAFVGVLGNAGIQGSMAGTAMANTYRYLTKSIEDTKFKGNKALAGLGLSKQDFLDANGSLIDMGLAMQKIAKATQGMPDTERFNTLVQILGVRGERGGSAMIKAFEDYTNLLGKLQNESQGTASEIIATRMETIAGGLNKMTSAWENVITSFTEAVSPTLTPIFNTFAALFDIIGRVLGTPIWGPIISGALVFSTTLITIRAGVTALKAGFRLMFNDSTISFRNMVAVMKQGWRETTLSGKQQQLIQGQIQTQARATAATVANGANQMNAAYSGLNSTLARTSLLMMAPNKIPRVPIITPAPIAPIPVGMTSAQIKRAARKQARQTIPTPQNSGTVVTRRFGSGSITSTTGGPTPTPRITPSSQVRSPGLGTTVTRPVIPTIVGVAPTIAKTAGAANNATKVGAVTAGVTAGLMRSGVIRGIGVALRGVLGFLGGPIGVALSALIFFLPTIISALGNNSDTVEKNTAALNKHFTDIEPNRLMKDRVNPLTAEEQLLVVSKALETLNETLMNKPIGQITINVDGKEAMSDVLDSNQAEQAINLGLK